MAQREGTILMPREHVMLTVCEEAERAQAEARKEKTKQTVREATEAYALAMQKLRELAVAETQRQYGEPDADV